MWRKSQNIVSFLAGYKLMGSWDVVCQCKGVHCWQWFQFTLTPPTHLPLLLWYLKIGLLPDWGGDDKGFGPNCDDTVIQWYNDTKWYMQSHNCPTSGTICFCLQFMMRKWSWSSSDDKIIIIKRQDDHHRMIHLYPSHLVMLVFEIYGGGEQEEGKLVPPTF